MTGSITDFVTRRRLLSFVVDGCCNNRAHLHMHGAGQESQGIGWPLLAWGKQQPELRDTGGSLRTLPCCRTQFCNFGSYFFMYDMYARYDPYSRHHDIIRIDVRYCCCNVHMYCCIQLAVYTMCSTQDPGDPKFLRRDLPNRY